MIMSLMKYFLKTLNYRKPDYFLEVDTTSLEASVGDIIRKSGEVLRKENPDAVLVSGRYKFMPCSLYGEKASYSGISYGSREQVFRF